MNRRIKVHKLAKEFVEVRKFAYKYFKNYGLKSFMMKAIQISKAGGLAYLDPVHNFIHTDANFTNILPEVILVSNDLRSPSHDYRVLNISQALWENGVANSILMTDQIEALSHLPKQVYLVYFWRTSLDLKTLLWYEKAVSDGVTIAYDSDDLTFETATYNMDNVHALRLIPKNEAEHLIKTVAVRQEMQVEQSTLGIGGTLELCSAFTRLGKKSVRVPIVLPRWMQIQGNKIYANKSERMPEAGFRIVYCSGSRSHVLDFEEAQEGIFEFLRVHPSASLTLQGASPISRDEAPKEIRGQINFHPMLRHDELLPYLAKFDVQIAPLEIGNNFVEAKSATKYMQGGIVGVPTVASPTEPFLGAIDSGTNGYIARNSREWFEALESLLSNTIRSQVSKTAYLDVIENHCLDSITSPVMEIAHSAKGIYESTIIPREASNRSKTITWLLPNLVPGSGGHRNVFRLANLLNGKEFHCQVYFYNETRGSEELANLTNTYYGKSSFEIISDRNFLHSSDVLVGVHNSSIPFIKRVASRNSKIAYLVQDFEPWFNPMSDSYLEALSTYFDDELSIFTSGAWMARKIEEVTGKVVPFFNFPVDRNVYNVNSTHQREGIIFFAKQDTYRRLFEFGKRVILEVHKASPNTPITLFGSNGQIDLGISTTEAGLLPTLDDLARLYHKSKVGIAFSPTNPSLVPYEMMACGLPVIDIDLPGSPMLKYGHHALLQPPVYSVELLVSRTLKLLGDDKYWQETSAAGVDFIKEMPTPEEAATDVRKFFIDLLKSESSK